MLLWWNWRDTYDLKSYALGSIRVRIPGGALAEYSFSKLSRLITYFKSWQQRPPLLCAISLNNQPNLD